MPRLPINGGGLLGRGQTGGELLKDYEPVAPVGLRFDRIHLAPGSLDTPERQRFVRRTCGLYPEAQITQCLDIPHNRVDLGEDDPLVRHRTGKRTLVFGEHKSAVRFSEEEGNTCPNYWHFSPYGFCPYDCAYCYLAGTQGVWHSPTVKVFVNLPEIIAQIDSVATRLARPTAFYLGKLQDGMALDALTGYSTVLVPFFAQHALARQVILTKCAEVERLLPLEHNGHTILSWSLNPPEAAAQFEGGTPGVEDRLRAMKLCAAKDYPVRAVLMPIIPVAGWETIYAEFVRELLQTVPIQRLTLGGICSYKQSRRLMEGKLGHDNVISRHIEPGTEAGDGRARYPQSLRIRMYSHIITAARQVRPHLQMAVCLEEEAVWEALELEGSRGRCNCVL